MRYYFSAALPYHWYDISLMIEDNYAHEYVHNDVLVMSVHHHQDINQIKENNPEHNKIIIYQLEPLVDGHWWGIDYIISRIKDADEVWDYDLHNIEVLKKHGIDAKFKPFRYSKSLKQIENKENLDIDVLFYGTANSYRNKIIEKLTNCGLEDKRIVYVWDYNNNPELLKEFIGRSKIILDLHTKEVDNNEYQIQKQSRIFYALINNKCVVSQKSYHNYFGNLIVECEEKDLLSKLEIILEKELWKEYLNVSERFRLLCEGKKMPNKVAIYYHVYQANDWKKLYQEQINSLIVSGLYDECDFIHVGINGDLELPFVLDKMKVQYNENKILEANTLQSMWEFCKENQDYRVMYFHTKGLTHVIEEDFSVSTNAWRIYLEYFTIHNWKTCLEDLKSYDCVGPEWIEMSSLPDPETQMRVYLNNPHYSGNFWWANSNYISTLDLDFIYNEDKGWTRFKSEFWIGTKSPKHKSYHNSFIVPLYNVNYFPSYYMNKNTQEEKALLDIVSYCDIDGHDKPGGTDKNSSHSYFPVYEKLFSPYKHKEGSILEIGIQYGGSLLLWQYYFSQFKVCGLDIHNAMHHNILCHLDSNRTRFFFLDAYDPNSLETLKQNYEEGFDIIIDDGPHFLESQVKCIELYLDILKVDGTLIIEDVDNMSFIEPLIASIPTSEIFKYEYEIYDLRNEKGRWDDILFVIKKTLKEPEIVNILEIE